MADEATLTATYKGPHLSVDVPIGGGRAVRIKRGGSAAVPEAVGIRLERQKHFHVPGAQAARLRAERAANEKSLDDMNKDELLAYGTTHGFEVSQRMTVGQIKTLIRKGGEAEDKTEDQAGNSTATE